MDAGLQRFARLLRLFGVAVSTGEVVDGLVATAAVGFADRETVKSALGAALVKDERDWPVFDVLFDQYFALLPAAGTDDGHAHSHGHEDLSDQADADRVTLSDDPSESPQFGHDHGKPVDIREYFDPEDMASQYNMHQQADKVDLSAMTEELVLSKDRDAAGAAGGNRVQVETSRLNGATSVQGLAPTGGVQIETELTLAEQQALLDWLADGEDVDDDVAADLRRRASAVIEGLPELLKAHLAKLAAQHREYERDAAQDSPLLKRISEAERLQMEEALRRLARQLHGALTHRKQVASRGRIDVGLTMRRNLRNDAVPFTPVTVKRREDRPRLVLLADVSLSVRNSARFTLHLVHGLQRMFSRVRTFAFVDDLVEVTETFHLHSLEAALGMVFGGRVLDVEANSDYGRSFRRFVDDHLSAVNHRTVVLVLGDGRGNGTDPGLEAFERISSAARSVVWLTPEPRYSWRLGRCDLPLYEPSCDRIEVCRDVRGLDRVAAEALGALTGPRGAREAMAR